MITLSELVSSIQSKMITSNKSLSVVESCTGGMVASSITACEGSSQWFDRGFVTYSNQSKVDLVSVDNDVLLKYGAVSEQTAKQMALGCIINSQTDFSLSITGIAGPGGGSDDKPVGMVCFAWAYKNNAGFNNLNASLSTKKTYICCEQTKFFVGDRDEVRIQSVRYSLEYLFNLIS